MSDVDRLLADYIAEHRAGGEADPGAYLSRASSAERAELAALIDAYLARAPRQPFDQARFGGSTAERTVDELERAIAGRPGSGPPCCPGCVTVPGSSAARSSIGSRPRSASRTGARRSPATTTRWSRACCRRGRIRPGARGAWADRRRDRTGTQRRWASAHALRRGPRRAGGRFARRASAEPAGAPSPGTQPPPSGEWDEVDELFRGA